MAHFDVKVEKEHEDIDVVNYNTRIGVILFFVYVAIYACFMGLSAFWPKLMAEPVFFGVNLAIFYGFVLIVAALALALLYMKLCRKTK